jgi:hypothetical protein
MKINIKYLFYYFSCFVIFLLQVFTVYDFKDLLLIVVGVLTVIKHFTSVSISNQFSNSYDIERLSKDQQNYPVMAYKDFLLILLPLILIIIYIYS